MATAKRDQPPEYWDRLFAPSSCLAVITTVDGDGTVNAASFGTCTRVNHNPVCIAFTCGADKHTAANIAASGEFVVNLPAFDRRMLEQVRIAGLPFARGVNELDKAGLTSLPSRIAKAPRIEEFPRHFECRVEWTQTWMNRLMVVGKVVAASVNDDCVDENGYVVWDKVKSAHFCGAPYHNMFVAAYETIAVDVPYDGPEVEAYDDYERQIFRDIKT
jgi:flavin reductase (DIM6/NTAB) family NADH-FMN oxidoreductase RutF